MDGLESIKLAKDMKLQLQQNHVKNALQQAGGDSKEMWKVLKELWPLKNKSSNIKSLNGECDDAKMANIMNDHLATIGSVLGEAHAEVNFKHFLPTAPPTFNLTKIDAQSVYTLLTEVCPSKACGLDGLTVRLIRDADDTLVCPLTHIFNLSIPTGVFPEDWKIAVVSPLYKDSPRDDPTNYRPISLLAITSKLLERIVHDQLYAFL